MESLATCCSEHHVVDGVAGEVLFLQGMEGFFPTTCLLVDYGDGVEPFIAQFFTGQLDGFVGVSQQGFVIDLY